VVQFEGSLNSGRPRFRYRSGIEEKIKIAPIQIERKEKFYLNKLEKAFKRTDENFGVWSVWMKY
jgi:hypothetical protein